MKIRREKKKETDIFSRQVKFRFKRIDVVNKNAFLWTTNGIF